MKKNYAGMAEVKSGDCMMLGLEIESQDAVVYLGDFSGGVCRLTDGASGYNYEYDLIGDKGGNVLQLIGDGKVVFRLYGVKSPQKHIGKDGFPFYADAELALGQLLHLELENNPYNSRELRLNSLRV